MNDPAPLTPDQILAVPWRCPRCLADLAPLTRICPNCRAPFQLPQEVWYHDRGMVLAMLFLVAGPLGIPWLLRSPRFSPAGKAALSVAVTVYTGLLGFGVWLLVALAWEKVSGVVK